MAKWKLVSKHTYEFTSAFPIYLRILGGFFVGLLMTAGGVLILVFGLAGGFHITPLIFGVLFVVFGLLLCGGMILSWPWKRVRWVRVYEEGLKWQAGRRECKYRWDEVTNVNRTEIEVVNAYGQRSDLGREAHLSLRFADGSSVTFDPALSSYYKLADFAQRAAAATQVADAAEELDETGKDFGLVHLSRKGVSVDGRAFAWKELRWLAVSNGELHAHHSCAKWRPIPLSTIPNAMLLLTLVRGLGRLRE
jgi:hypothetical protein